jgi:hypothetical protein
MKISDLKQKLPAKKLVFSLVGDVAALMFFGVGYLVVDHFNDWIDTQTPSEVSAQTKSSKPSASHTFVRNMSAITDRDRTPSVRD